LNPIEQPTECLLDEPNEGLVRGVAPVVIEENLIEDQTHSRGLGLDGPVQFARGTVCRNHRNESSSPQVCFVAERCK
jgi:hypothetical protein